MEHLTEDQIYYLAVKVEHEEDLTPEEERLLMHITTCDSCYHLMAATMTMKHIADNIGKYARPSEEQHQQEGNTNVLPSLFTLPSFS